MMCVGRGLVISPRIEEIVDMWLHFITDSFLPFPYYGCREGVGYFTKSRRISWTFGYTPQQRPGICFHMMRVGRGLVISPRIEEIMDMWLHLITDFFLSFPYYGCG
jgi:hypothetical protein